MYGLVNRAIEQMVCSKFGPETWESIRQRAGLDVDGFIALRTYPDEVTYKLVGAASEVLNLAPAAVLEAFGEYWILETARTSYAGLMEISGRTLPEFLQNLDQMHSRLGLTFKHYTPPSFQCTDVQPGSLVLHYRSTRNGLLPFVIGLVKGLGQWFGTPAAVEVLSRREEGADHDTLLITMAA
jgi:hypothetical protein